MADLQEIMQLLGKATVKMEDAERKLPKAKESVATLQQLERVALRYLALARRMGLPDDVAKATEFFSRLIIMLRMAQMSYNMLMAGTGVGLLMGIAGMGMTALSAVDFAKTEFMMDAGA